MKRTTWFGASLLALSLCVGGPAIAAMDYNGLGFLNYYQQTGAPGLTPIDGVFAATTFVDSPSDFNQVTIGAPTGSHQSYSFSPTFNMFGDYSATYTQDFASQALRNAAYPKGTYTVTATNTVTSASQSTTLNYDADHRPSTTPVLTHASYAGLQGMDTTAPFQFNFNNFTGDGVTQPGNGLIDPRTQIAILDSTKGQYVYFSPQLPHTTTSYILPANSLQPGDDYIFGVTFDNFVYPDPGGQLPYFLDFSDTTIGEFTAAPAAPPPVTLVDLQGGTPSAPTTLPVTGRIGEVTGSIGGVGSTDFYQFFWSRTGLFQATTTVDTTNPDASYAFELTDGYGNPIKTIELNSGNSFTATLTDYLRRGLYEIGLVADDPHDPHYSISFQTPVSGVVPEPMAWQMLIAGVGLAGLAARRRRAALA
jgi:hypothetical protein